MEVPVNVTTRIFGDLCTAVSVVDCEERRVVIIRQTEKMCVSIFHIDTPSLQTGRAHLVDKLIES